MHVSGNKQIQPPIAVVVAPRCSGRPVAKLHAGLLRNVGKRSVVIVVVQPILAPVGNKNIRPAIVVVVGHRCANTPAVVGYTGFGCYVGKCSVVIVVEERCVRRCLFAVERIEGGAVDDVNIEPAVVVVIDQAHAGAIGFNDVLLLRRSHLVGPLGEPGFL